MVGFVNIDKLVGHLQAHAKQAPSPNPPPHRPIIAPLPPPLLDAATKQQPQWGHNPD